MNINQIKKQALSELEKIQDLLELEMFRVKYLGRKDGELTAILRSLKDLPIGKRKKIGEEANKFRQELIEMFEQKKKKISAQGESRLAGQTTKLDITAPGVKLPHGHLHPITNVLKQVEEIFGSMGFEIVEGPDIETEYYNFDALNIPDEHPARDAWNTFWLKSDKLLLRTHTSPMQARYMEKKNPPLRIIVPGRVFRYEATDDSHSHTFYQIEGLMVDKDISVANFRAVIEEFFKRFFKQDIIIRLRPSYFPFTEPSFEVDVKGGPPTGEAGKFKDWLEIMGAGMVHPNVLKAVGYVPGEWQGFAFGMGLERLAMIKYGIDDIRLFYSGDLRFLKQF